MPDRTNATRLYQRAMMRRDLGDLKATRDRLYVALLYDPTHPEALRELAKVEKELEGKDE